MGPAERQELANLKEERENRSLTLWSRCCDAAAAPIRKRTKKNCVGRFSGENTRMCECLLEMYSSWRQITISGLAYSITEIKAADRGNEESLYLTTSEAREMFSSITGWSVWIANNAFRHDHFTLRTGSSLAAPVCWTDKAEQTENHTGSWSECSTWGAAQ